MNCLTKIVSSAMLLGFATCTYNGDHMRYALGQYDVGEGKTLAKTYVSSCKPFPKELNMPYLSGQPPRKYKC